MRVRAHEAEGLDEDAVSALVASEELEELVPRTGSVEDVLMVVSAPGAVVRRVVLDEQEARDAGHPPRMSKSRAEMAGPNITNINGR